MDWYGTRSSIQSSVPSGKKTRHSSSAWTITERKRWCDRFLETSTWSSEQIWARLILVWWYVEEQDGRRWSILYWPVRTRNSLPPSSLSSFRTQSQWSYIAWQCIDSEHFLRVHLSYWMCTQCTLHHKFRIDSGRTTFKPGKTDSILYGCESHEWGSQGSARAWFDQTTSCIVQAKVEKAPRYGVLGRFSACPTERIEILSNKM